MGHGLRDGGVTLAYDTGPGVGMGHRRRMEALAGALGSLGVPHSLVALDAGFAEGGGGGVEGAVVVVDSYRHRADAASIRARRRVAVDELGRDLAVDLLVDPSPAPSGNGNRGEGSAVLRGLDYALLDPEVAAVAPAPAGDPVATVLVTTGAADEAGHGARIAAEVAAGMPEIEVRLVEGRWGRRERPAGVVLVPAPDGLVSELAGAGLVATAAGVTMLEALAAGRPTVAFAVARNQRPYLDGLAAAGAVDATSADGAAAAVVALAGDASRRDRLAAAGRAAVDGAGAARVAKAVAALL